MERCVGKGRGIATNVPEAALIQEVKKRALLYDKKLKEYRRPGISDDAWSQVATALNTSVSNCKKRWKSLRDTFIKYYRIEQMPESNSRDVKKRRWHFYNDLKFLKPHVELFRLDDSSKTEEEEIPIYLKENYIEVQDDGEKHFYFEEEGSPDGIRYQIKIDQQFEETEQNDGEQLLNNFTEDPEHHIDEIDEGNKYVLVESHEEDEIQNDKIRKEAQYDITTEPNEKIQRNIIDPDERYLLSCLPAFKRLSPQQKALVRIGIEKLFYEVEFENEPPSKRLKSS